ncbi:MAG: sigma-54-dependent Fis family transcriptional regulator [Phycisphaerales bacterium]|nr:sigma-54-dependent Fis family transcriptional regulator [Phycisphaerales bacterium]MCB9840358.1 sigma-54-dependent Fis family transcriptional regulator [Phycisphaeraceae bacterium]
MSMVLVVDDKEMMRESVGATLRRAGFEVCEAGDGGAALETIARVRPDAVVTDLRMPGLTGIELLERVRAIDEDLPVVLMTAFGTVETAVGAMKAGAFDYVTKPFEGDELIIAVKRAIAHAALVRENAVLRATSGAGTGAASTLSADGSTPGVGIGRIIGNSPAIRRVKEQVLAVAGSHGTVLICGESGSGKEVIARAIHELSPRAASPFLAVNCAALSESLLESELFGHERGAFTGADRLRKGRFELAQSGTLLLDEVSEIGAPIQAKLLRVLQERAFERVGSSTTIGVDVRIVATSNRDLPQSVKRGEFRHDLFFRLNVLPIHLPPLRDRVEDIPAMAEFFVRQVCAREGREGLSFSPEAMALLGRYRWPGNVRELQNVCERAVVLSAAGAGAIERSLIESWLSVGDVAAASVMTEAKPSSGATSGLGANGHAGGLSNGHANGAGGTNGSSYGTVSAPMDTEYVQAAGRTLEEIERDVIVRTLGRFNGHRQKTARSLGIGVRTLGLKLKKWKDMRIVPATL